MHDVLCKKQDKNSKAKCVWLFANINWTATKQIKYDTCVTYCFLIAVWEVGGGGVDGPRPRVGFWVGAKLWVGLKVITKIQK